MNERPPWIIAHRGVSAHFPENTRASFDAAVDVGADALELDVQLTRDEELVIFHDRTLERHGHGPHRIRDMDLADLEGLDVGSWFNSVFSSERILTLTDVLERYGKLIPLCIELKSRDEVDERKETMTSGVLSLVQEYKVASTCYMLCFDAEMLERLHSAARNLRMVWNIRDPAEIDEADLATRTWLFGVDGKIAGLTSGFTAMARDHGMVPLTYTCNQREQVVRAMTCGVDAIITDDPEKIRAQVLESG